MDFPQAHHFEPVGRCIYCGAKSNDLTLEHIIPFGLGGRLELPEASCGECQKLTQKFEEDCLRFALVEGRTRLGISGRRNKKGRLNKLRIGRLDNPSDPSSAISYEYLPVEDHPTIIGLPNFIPATKNNAGWGVNGIIIVPFPGFFDKFAELGPGAINFQPGKWASFARMFAKIGHAAAVAKIGIDGFEPYLLDLIKGTDQSRSGYVGTAIREANRSSNPYELRLILTGSEIIANVRIFANLVTASYEVIVGRYDEAKARNDALGAFAT